MITNFKIFEKLETDLKIGDYVIMKYTFDDRSFWNNWYGTIVDIGYNSDNKTKKKNLFLIKLMNDDAQDDGENQNKYIKSTTNYKRLPNNCYVWTHLDYIRKYKTKKNFDKAVEKIELEKTAKKFGL